jgi:hypothetical protein
MVFTYGMLWYVHTVQRRRRGRFLNTRPLTDVGKVVVYHDPVVE